MAKKTTVFVCNECGYESPKWMGKCPACGAWNSFFEEKVVTGSSKTKEKNVVRGEVVKLKEIEKTHALRLKTGINELDRVLGGGFVVGSLTLLGGEPGIGKSTLILQICNRVQLNGKILYVSGEESPEQIKLRADRLGIDNDNLLFLAETDIDHVEEVIEKEEPEFVMIDSVQTMYSEEISSAPGSISQVREITARIMKMCKRKQITTIIIGHVTKDGNIAGPRVLEHMVDTVLYLEGERYFTYRILRGVKNRFGSTNEIGMFEMEGEGLVEIVDPSSVLISEREEGTTGTVVVVSMEGTRPILLELQALSTPTVFGNPRRTAGGVDLNRLVLLIAVLEKRVGMKLSSQDVYLKLVGGMRVNDPALDLGIVLAVASNFRDVSIPGNIAAIGEVGLTGEVRSVNMIEKRINEAEKLGYQKIFIPQSNKKSLKNNYKLDIIGVRNIGEALRYLNLI